MLEVDISKGLSVDLRAISKEIEAGLPDIMLAIGEELTGFILEDFETKSRGGVGANGVQWAPLNEKTVKKKAKRAKGGDTSTQIGVDTGLMRATVQPGFSDPDGKGGNVMEVSGGEVTVGFGRAYAKYFDEGTSPRASKANADQGLLKTLTSSAVEAVAKTGNPARPLIPDELPSDWREAAEEILAEEIELIWNSKLGGS